MVFLATTPLLFYAGVTVLTVLMFSLLRRFNNVSAAAPVATILPRAIVYSVAFVGLTDFSAFPEHVLTSCGDGGGALSLALSIGLGIVAAIIGALFFAYDGTLWPNCNWAVTRATCCAKHVSWSVQAARVFVGVASLCVLANNVLTSLVASGVWLPSTVPPCWLAVPPAPQLVAGSAVTTFVLQQVAWVAWLLGVPALYLLLQQQSTVPIKWHFHHYGIAFYAGVLVRGATVWGFTAQAAAWGIFLQGAWAASMEPMLYETDGPSGASSATTTMNSRTTYLYT